MNASACRARWLRMPCCGGAALRAGFALALPAMVASSPPMPGSRSAHDKIVGAAEADGFTRLAEFGRASG